MDRHNPEFVGWDLQFLQVGRQFQGQGGLQLSLRASFRRRVVTGLICRLYLVFPRLNRRHCLSHFAILVCCRFFAEKTRVISSDFFHVVLDGSARTAAGLALL